MRSQGRSQSIDKIWYISLWKGGDNNIKEKQTNSFGKRTT